MADTVKKQRAPAGLKPAGRALWSRFTTFYLLDVREVALLDAACRQADLLAELERVVEREGVMVIGSRGQQRVHPAVVEMRAGRVVLRHLLGAIALPNEVSKPMTASALRASKAASARWDRARARKERLAGGETP